MRIYIGGANDGIHIPPMVAGGVFDFCVSYYPPGKYDNAWRIAAKKNACGASTTGGRDDNVHRRRSNTRKD